MLKFLKDHEINYSTAMIFCVVMITCAYLVATGKAPVSAFIAMATAIVTAFTQPIATKKEDTSNDPK